MRTSQTLYIVCIDSIISFAIHVQGVYLSRSLQASRLPPTHFNFPPSVVRGMGAHGSTAPLIATFVKHHSESRHGMT